jgi:uncharacterized membrane protein YkoI
MKINQFVALAAIALLVVAAMGVIATRSLARGPAPVMQAQSCDQQDSGTDVQGASPETDNVDQQCGDQNAPDTGQALSSSEHGASGNVQDSAPTGTPAITTEQAQAAALAVHSGTVLKTELDDENGKLVYSVQFEGDVEVKVDAMSGSVVSTETGQN